MQTEADIGLLSSIHGDPRGTFAEGALGSVLTYNAGHAYGGRARRGRIVSFRQLRNRRVGLADLDAPDEDSRSPYRPTKRVATAELERHNQRLRGEGHPALMESVTQWAIFFRIDGRDVMSAIQDAADVAAIIYSLPPDVRLVAETMRKKHWASAVLDVSQLVDFTKINAVRVNAALDHLRGHGLLETFSSGYDSWAALAPGRAGYSIKAPGVYGQSREDI